jgi:hypothetical protein
MDLATRKVTIKNDYIYYKKTILGGTRLGLPIFEIEITAPHNKNSKLVVNLDQRKIVYIVAR